MAIAVEEHRLPPMAPMRTLDSALEGLASAGYSVNADTWERFIDAGLLRHSKGASPRLTEVSAADLARFRTILDVEIRLGPHPPIDLLAFYLCATGMPDVPTAKIVDFIEAGMTSFFSSCEIALRALPRLPTRLGLDGERALARRLATSLLESTALHDRRERAALEMLAEICCTLYLRAMWRNRAAGRGPAPRILTPALLEAANLSISAMSAGRPLTSAAAETSLPPTADIARVLDDLRNSSYSRSADIAAAAADAVTVVERGCTGLTGEYAPVLQALVPVLAAAFARMRAFARPLVCERIAKSAWAEPEAMRSELLLHWT